MIEFTNDPWSGYLSAEAKARHPEYTFATIDATHDDIWLNSDKYVEIVQKGMGNECLDWASDLE